MDELNPSQAHQRFPTVPEMEAVRAVAQRSQGSFLNRVLASTTSGAGLPSATTAAQTLIFGAAMLKVKTSGIFAAGISVNMGGFTAADTVDITVNTITNTAGAMVMTQATELQGLDTRYGVFTNHGQAGGILVSNQAATLLRADTGVRIIDATDVGFEFNWNAVLMNTITPTSGLESPFAQGNDVLVTVSMNRSAHTNTFLDFTMFMYELP